MRFAVARSGRCPSPCKASRKGSPEYLSAFVASPVVRAGEAAEAPRRDLERRLIFRERFLRPSLLRQQVGELLACRWHRTLASPGACPWNPRDPPRHAHRAGTVASAQPAAGLVEFRDAPDFTDHRARLFVLRRLKIGVLQVVECMQRIETIGARLVLRHQRASGARRLTRMKKPRRPRLTLRSLVERKGIEPSTSALRTRRSPS